MDCFVLRPMRRIHIIALLLTAACGGPARLAAPPAVRTPDSADERIAAMRDNNPVAGAAGAEERFAPDQHRAKRTQDRANEKARQQRVDVVDKDKKPPPPPPQK